MLDYKLLEALAMVSKEKGFDKAAEKLYITQSAVSQRIKLLEEQQGQILITRMSPPVPTGRGKQLIKHYSQVKQLEGELKDSHDAESDYEYTSITIALNADSLATWFLDALNPLLKKENILVDLKVDDQDQTSVFLKNGEVSGCISSAKIAIQGCNVHYLGIMEYALVCTPEFYHRWFKDGLSLNQIQKAPAVLYNRKDNLHYQFLNKLFKQNLENIPVNYIPSSEKILSFITNGLAYGFIPLYQCENLLKENKILELDDNRLQVDLYWHHWNINSNKIQALSHTIINESKKFLK
jgi:LysR family transcriptional regulator, chromosome initiation inhibitor